MTSDLRGKGPFAPPQCLTVLLVTPLGWPLRAPHAGQLGIPHPGQPGIPSLQDSHRACLRPQASAGALITAANLPLPVSSCRCGGENEKRLQLFPWGVG